MKLTLYYAPIACSLVPMITLAEAGADFNVVPVNFRKAQQMSPDYLKLNPKHKVPVLIIDGEPLTENVAIQLWIARTFPQAKLLPSDPQQEIKAISLMAWCASGIHPHLSRINSPVKFCDAAGSEDSVRRLAAEEVFENFSIADAMLAGREWFFGHFTAADAYFFWCWRRATIFNLDLAAFTNCAAHAGRMAQRASVQKALAFEKQVQAEFAKAA
jgi:glutathione S-transferase